MYSLRKRLDRLEGISDANRTNLPPQFWDALYGLCPWENLAPATRQLIELLFEDRRDESDPIEAAILAVGCSDGGDGDHHAHLAGNANTMLPSAER